MRTLGQLKICIAANWRARSLDIKAINRVCVCVCVSRFRDWQKLHYTNTHGMTRKPEFVNFICRAISHELRAFRLIYNIRLYNAHLCSLFLSLCLTLLCKRLIIYTPLLKEPVMHRRVCACRWKHDNCFDEIYQCFCLPLWDRNCLDKRGRYLWRCIYVVFMDALVYSSTSIEALEIYSYVHQVIYANVCAVKFKAK